MGDVEKINKFEIIDDKDSPWGGWNKCPRCAGVVGSLVGLTKSGTGEIAPDNYYGCCICGRVFELVNNDDDYVEEN